MANLTLSANHVTFIGDYEYTLVQGTIYKCSISNVLNINTGNRDGRFECELSFALRYRKHDLYGHLCDMIEVNSLQSYCKLVAA
jgi:hypothetical protein